MSSERFADYDNYEEAFYMNNEKHPVVLYVKDLSEREKEAEACAGLEMRDEMTQNFY